MRIARLARTSTVRFAALYTLIFCVSVALLLGFIYDATVRAVDREIEVALQTELASLQEVHRRLGSAGLIDVVRARSVDPTTSTNSAYLLVDKALQPVAGNLAQWPATRREAGGRLEFTLDDPGEGTSGPRLYRAHVLVLPDGGRLLVAHSIDRRARAQRLVTDALAWGLAATLLLGVAGGFLISRAVLRRMEAIADTCARIVDGQMSERIAVSGTGDELDRLAIQLNRMLERIEQLVEGMRTMSDNIAHELRSPLTRLRAAVDTALAGPPDAERYRDALQKALLETDRVLTVFGAVMTITQARFGLLRGQMEVLDLAALAAEAAELYEPVSEARSVSLEVRAPAPVAVFGHRQLLAQVLVNLLDNAMKFTPAGGSVRVSVAQSAGRAVATVADTGPGIEAQARERLLAPFARGDGCAGIPGNGLGLSLVAEVARLHGAALALEDNAPGLRVTLTLPVRGDVSASHAPQGR